MTSALYGNMKASEKIARLAKNKSELGRAAGIAQPEMHKIVRGERRLYLDVALRIARALQVPLEYLADDAIEEIPRPAISDDEAELLKIARRLGVERSIDRLLMKDESFIKPPAKGQSWQEIKTANEELAKQLKRGGA